MVCGEEYKQAHKEETNEMASKSIEYNQLFLKIHSIYLSSVSEKETHSQTQTIN